jgi:hypothetical protein
MLIIIAILLLTIAVLIASPVSARMSWLRMVHRTANMIAVVLMIAVYAAIAFVVYSVAIG